jgi:subtilisin family serine protease
VGHVEELGFYHGRFAVGSFETANALCETLENNGGISMAMPELLIPSTEWTEVGSSKKEGDKNWGQRKIEMYAAQELVAAHKKASVNIGVCDGSVRVNHPDLQLTGVFRENKVSAENNPHGTLVSGIIGAVQNDIGLRGVVPDANLYFACIDEEGAIDSKEAAASDTEDALYYEMLNNPYKSLSAIQYALFWLAKQDCKVINCSFGYWFIDWMDKQGTSDQNLLNLVEDYDRVMAKNLQLLLKNDDVLLINAAGNGRKAPAGRVGIDAADDYGFARLAAIYPGIKESLLVVGAIDNFNRPNNVILNYGSSVDIVAPGDKIYSLGDEANPLNEYGFSSGTSVAAPFVAGVAGLVWEVNPDLTASQVKEIIINSTRDNDIINRPATDGKTYGYPVLNARMAVQAALPQVRWVPEETTPPTELPATSATNSPNGVWFSNDSDTFLQIQSQQIPDGYSLQTDGTILSSNGKKYQKMSEPTMPESEYIALNKFVSQFYENPEYDPNADMGFPDWFGHVTQLKDGGNGTYTAKVAICSSSGIGEENFVFWNGGKVDLSEFWYERKIETLKLRKNNGQWELAEPSTQKSDKWKQLYTDVIRKCGWGVLGDCQYVLHDIDWDGTPELIVDGNPVGANSGMELYTAKDGKLIALDSELLGRNFYNQKAGELIVENWIHGELFVEIITLKNGRIINRFEVYDWTEDTSFQGERELKWVQVPAEKVSTRTIR